MKVIVVKNYDELSELGASIIAKLIKEKPDCTLGLATGSSPVGTYQNLIKAYNNGEISFKDVHSYNLDEYCGIDRNHPQSYYYFMHDNLFNHVDIKEENTHVPYAAPGSDLDKEAKKYTEALNSVEIDLQLLGIGGNGHIGFNEPGTPFFIPARTVGAITPNSSQISHSVMAVAPMSVGKEILPYLSIVMMFLSSFIAVLFLRF